MSSDMQPVMSLSSGSFICCTRLGLSTGCWSAGGDAAIGGSSGGNTCGGLGAPAATTTTVFPCCCCCCCSWSSFAGAGAEVAGGLRGGSCNGTPEGAAVGEMLIAGLTTCPAVGGAWLLAPTAAVAGPWGLAAVAPQARGCSCSIFFWTTMCCAMAHALAHTSPVLRATVRCAAACVTRNQAAMRVLLSSRACHKEVMTPRHAVRCHRITGQAA